MAGNPEQIGPFEITQTDEGVEVKNTTQETAWIGISRVDEGTHSTLWQQECNPDTPYRVLENGEIPLTNTDGIQIYVDGKDGIENVPYSGESQ